MPQQPEHDASRRSRWLFGLLLACGVYVVAIAFVPGLVGRSPLLCPTQRLLGLHCPSCGMTRALACLVRLDPAAAIRCNPLVIVAAPFVIVMLIDTARTAVGRPSLTPSLPPWLTQLALISFFGGFLTLFVIRGLSWVAPSCNPDGWCLPPEQFPP